jgi:BolA family transcriptional regulator, general stress-responsive regulator
VTGARVEMIRAALSRKLSPQQLEIIDESHLHAGHAGARDGRGHFRVRVVSDAFNGLSKIKRHQLVYQAVGNLMETDIHALSVAALTPEENGSG